MKIIKSIEPEHLSIRDGKVLYNGEAFLINTGIVTAPHGYDGARGLTFVPSPAINVLEEWLVNYGTHSFMRDNAAYGILSDNFRPFNASGEAISVSSIDLPFTGTLLVSVTASGTLVIHQIKVKQSKHLPDGWVLTDSFTALRAFNADNTVNHHESDDLPDECVLDDGDHKDHEDSHCE